MTPRASQAEGRNFESVLMWKHREYLNAGRAAIYHNQIAGKFVNEGRFVPAPEKSRPDYSGTISPGIAIHFDAKTMGDSVGWRLSREQMHQYDELMEQAKMGALAFFLVECRPLQAVFLLRVHPFIPVEDGRPGMIFSQVPETRQEVAPRICLPVGSDGMYDWLSAIEGVWIRMAPNFTYVGELARKRKGKRGPCPHTAQRNREMVEIYLSGRETRPAMAERLGLSLYQVNDILKQDPRVKLPHGGRRKGQEMNSPTKSVRQELVGVHNGHLPAGVRLPEDDIPLAMPAMEEHR